MPVGPVLDALGNPVDGGVVGVGVGVDGDELCVGVGVGVDDDVGLGTGLEDGVAVTVTVAVTVALTVALAVTVVLAVTVCVTVARGGLGLMQTTLIRSSLRAPMFTGFATHRGFGEFGVFVVVAWTPPAVAPAVIRTAVRAVMAARFGVMWCFSCDPHTPRRKVAARLTG